jgi:hypothetical protein
MSVPLTPDQIRLTAPDQIRLAARIAKYSNSVEERTNVARVDGEVFDRVRVFEQQVASNARDFISDSQLELNAADELETAIRREVRYALNEGAKPDAVAYRHTTLVASAKVAIESLERAERESEWHAARLADPYAFYSTLVSKYPTLTPLIAI